MSCEKNYVRYNSHTSEREESRKVERKKGSGRRMIKGVDIELSNLLCEYFEGIPQIWGIVCSFYGALGCRFLMNRTRLKKVFLSESFWRSLCFEVASYCGWSVDALESTEGLIEYTKIVRKSGITRKLVKEKKRHFSRYELALHYFLRYFVGHVEDRMISGDGKTFIKLMSYFDRFRENMSRYRDDGKYLFTYYAINILMVNGVYEFQYNVDFPSRENKSTFSVGVLRSVNMKKYVGYNSRTTLEGGVGGRNLSMGIYIKRDGIYVPDKSIRYIQPHSKSLLMKTQNELKLRRKNEKEEEEEEGETAVNDRRGGGWNDDDDWENDRKRKKNLEEKSTLFLSENLESFAMVMKVRVCRRQKSSCCISYKFFVDGGKVIDLFDFMSIKGLDSQNTKRLGYFFPVFAGYEQLIVSLSNPYETSSILDETSKVRIDL